MLAQLVSGAGTRSKFYQGALYRVCQLVCRNAEKRFEYSIKNTLNESSVTAQELSDSTPPLITEAVK